MLVSLSLTEKHRVPLCSQQTKISQLTDCILVPTLRSKLCHSIWLLPKENFAIVDIFDLITYTRMCPRTQKDILKFLLACRGSISIDCGNLDDFSYIHYTSQTEISLTPEKIRTYLPSSILKPFKISMKCEKFSSGKQELLNHKTSGSQAKILPTSSEEFLHV